MLTFCRHLPAQKVTVTRQAIGKTQKNALIVGLLLSPLQSAVWHTGRWHEPVHPSWNIIYQCALLLPSTNTTKYWGLPNGPIGDGAAGRWSGKCRPCAPATAGLNAAGSVVNGLPDSLVQNISLGAEAETKRDIGKQVLFQWYPSVGGWSILDSGLCPACFGRGAARKRRAWLWWTRLIKT